MQWYSFVNMDVALSVRGGFVGAMPQLSTKESFAKDKKMEYNHTIERF